MVKNGGYIMNGEELVTEELLVAIEEQKKQDKLVEAEAWKEYWDNVNGVEEDKEETPQERLTRAISELIKEEVSRQITKARDYIPNKTQSTSSYPDTSIGMAAFTIACAGAIG